MSKVLVVGVGLQGRAVVHDLVSRRVCDEVVAADVDPAAAARASLRPEVASAVSFVALPPTPEGLASVIAEQRPDVVVGMSPPWTQLDVARAALDASAHFVNTCYARDLAEVAEVAAERGLALLPEMGLDPGIDLLLCRRALDALDEVHGLESYGAGLPEPSCADDNPLRYKVTWTFEGVLSAYLRPARFLRDGALIDVPGDEMFDERHVHEEVVEGIGPLEAYPNGDAMKYVEPFELGDGLVDMARFGLRYPGHCAFWYRVAKMGLLDEAPIDLDGGRSASPREVLARVMAPRLAFGEGERDVVVLRVRARGLRAGAPAEVVLDLLDWRDLETGLFAMNRTVGFMASVAAQMLLEGSITGRGLLSPARDVPVDVAFEHLAARGIQVR